MYFFLLIVCNGWKQAESQQHVAGATFLTQLFTQNDCQFKFWPFDGWVSNRSNDGECLRLLRASRCGWDPSSAPSGEPWFWWDWLQAWSQAGEAASACQGSTCSIPGPRAHRWHSWLTPKAVPWGCCLKNIQKGKMQDLQCSLRPWINSSCLLLQYTMQILSGLISSWN